MSEQILKNLKTKLEEELNGYGSVSSDIKLNKVKEILQYYVLNFIYHHPEYSKWIMYGGSALRIIHELDRMSVDLDFEVSRTVTEKFLEELKKEVEDYFANTYNAGADFLTIKIITGRSLRLKFHIGKELSLGKSSNQVYVQIDLNHFFAPKTVIERRQINRGQFSFVILTYNMGALMASKLAAIFLRDPRGIDDKFYDYKGRDIYDLLWYMSKKTTPDLDYLNAKLKERGLEIPEIKTLFDKLTIGILNYEKMDELLKKDLFFLFENPFQFEGWFKTWRKSYLRLLDEYKIRTIKELADIRVHQDFLSDIFSFIFYYNTEEGQSVRVIYTISDYWIEFQDGNLMFEINKEVEDKIEFSSNGSSSKSVPLDKLKQYATLFYYKTGRYFKKTNSIMLGDVITTKVIRMTVDNLNPKEQIFLRDKFVLDKIELDDLLK